MFISENGFIRPRTTAEGVVESKPPKALPTIEPSLSESPSPPPDPTPLGVLRLSARPHFALTQAGITTIGQLSAMSHEQIREARRVGEKELTEIEEKLATYLAEHPLHDVPQQQGCEMPDIISENVHPHESKKTPIAVLKLSADIRARLKLVGVTTIEDLARMSPEHILDVPYIDEKSLPEIEPALTDYLVEHFPSGPPFEPEEPSSANAPLRTLGLSVRSHNALMRAGIRTVGKLAEMSDEDLLSVHNLGIKSLADIREKLAAYLAEHPLPLQPPSPPPDQAPLGVLGLSFRSYNALMHAGITTIGQLIAMSREQICEVRNVGQKGLTEIEEKLKAYLTEHLLSDEVEEGPSEPEAQAAEPLPSQPLSPPPDPTSLGVLGLSARSHNALKWAGITTIGQLAAMSREQIQKVRNIGEKALAEIESKLEFYLADPSRSKAPDVVPEPLPMLPALLPSDSEILGTSADEQTLTVQVEKWLSALTDHQRQVIRWRYGLDGEQMTLEEVGQCLGITRERVRQIEAKATRRLYRPAHRRIIQPLTQLVRQKLLEAGGLSTETRLSEAIAEAISIGNIDPQGVVRLLLTTHSDFSEIKRERAWGLSDLPLNLVAVINRHVAELLAAEYAPLSKDELLTRLKATRWYQEHADQLSDVFILACVNSSEKVVCRDDRCYGLEKWERQYQDDIILALRRLGQPTHYSEIAETINAELPSERHIAPRAVHIRLMQHPELFVWVGRRGTYGLKEWGLERSLSYEEALVRILQQAGHPLTFQQILAQLPALRFYYDETSIVLTLGTNERFRSFPGDTYGLAEWREDEVVTEDYRLQRLLDGVEGTPSSTRLKPAVMEALNSVDSFIAQAREKASDGQ